MNQSHATKHKNKEANYHAQFEECLLAVSVAALLARGTTAVASPITFASGAEYATTEPPKNWGLSRIPRRCEITVPRYGGTGQPLDSRFGQTTRRRWGA